ncbi:hypothetical protein BSZ19_21795 [Bradyrhizobium japonicum]|uniref:Uncharacterized protein n=1 Tax=Bradyrhizobium japonicum TaxID=375 RepID=A0A1Y2JM74_BRAJP|nr:hypothetical protein BSZ19_21795 [Bradyrhizobium japonicum]
MYREPVLDELRQVERQVVEGEGQLAEQEALVFGLKRQKQDTSKAEDELERMRTDQRRLQQERQRLLSGLQP